ncbi:MAG TPA: hypothetical protein VNG90_03065 [Candidatus Acidoferrum sp.]|nr:hypothetical protein [Candidatus Acidoferrum sp.]
MATVIDYKLLRIKLVWVFVAMILVVAAGIGIIVWSPWSQTPINTSTQSVIDIKEWGVGLSVAAPGAYYVLNNDGTVYITTYSLEDLLRQIKGCTSGLHGLTIDSNLKEQRPNEPACAIQTSSFAMQIEAIQQQLRSALAKPYQTTDVCSKEAELSAGCAKARSIY